MFRPTHFSSMLCVHGLLSSSPGAGAGGRWQWEQRWGKQRPASALRLLFTSRTPRGSVLPERPYLSLCAPRHSKWVN